ncbi:methyl-accepting chemotaxis protein [Methylobacillus gramineus]|uniref:methyl-accepting chemotaxis protein n=1 Tax=Methylobacillus gramineus TaxID=755169 RepID=UPI00299E0B29|nr:methyl-accepting chemotaxis protein [Methylobacillus gramineus]
MRWIYDLKVSNKLILGFVFVLALTSILGLFSIMQLRTVNQASTDISENWLPSAEFTLEMKAMLGRMRVQELQHILSSSEDEYSRYEAQFDKFLSEFQTSMKRYDGVVSEPREKELLPKIKSEFELYMSEHGKIVALSRNNQNDEARTLLRGKSFEMVNLINDQVDELVNLNTLGAQHASEMAVSTYDTARIWIIVLLISCVTLGLVSAVWIARMIAEPLLVAVNIAQRVAGGDLTAQIEVTSKDETGELMKALKLMNDNLSNIVGEVRSGTDTIATASSEIATGNLDLSSRTEEQASSLEETASAMEELTSTVKQNADNARQANQLAASASQVAVQGGEVVDQVISTMAAINESSKRIADIIGVIDGIAFQTNILALNAAVEAARAGEQGRGFAVVATEVRSLAQRSANAAKEIKSLIGDSVDSVSAGSKLVEQAGSTMSEVVNSVKRVTDIVSEISAASEEQSTGIEQVNQAIMQMDEVTQQNAALVEEAAAASQSLQDQASSLASAVSIFKINGWQPKAAVAEVVKSRPVTVKAKAGKPVVSRRAKPVTPSTTSASPASAAISGDDWAEF